MEGENMFNGKRLSKIEAKLDLILRYIIQRTGCIHKRLELLENQRVGDLEEMSRLGTSYNQIADGIVNLQWAVNALKPRPKRKVRKGKKGRK